MTIIRHSEKWPHQAVHPLLREMEQPGVFRQRRFPSLKVEVETIHIKNDAEMIQTTKDEVEKSISGALRKCNKLL